MGKLNLNGFHLKVTSRNVSILPKQIGTFIDLVKSSKCKIVIYWHLGQKVPLQQDDLKSE